MFSPSTMLSSSSSTVCFVSLSLSKYRLWMMPEFSWNVTICRLWLWFAKPFWLSIMTDSAKYSPVSSWSWKPGIVSCSRTYADRMTMRRDDE